MSAYKLIEVRKTSEAETQSIYDRDDLTTAIADMKDDFGKALKTDDILSVYCVVIEQATGERVDGKYWILPTVVEGLSDISIRQRVYTHNDYQDDNLAPYDSEQLAIANFNTKSASAMKKEECNFAVTIRIDSTGKFAEKDVFHRPQPQAE